MEENQEEVVEKFNTLETSLITLESFIHTAPFFALTDKEQEALVNQRDNMRESYQVLKLKIKKFKE